MKIQDLADIVAICEEGSFRKASKRLGITQPTLSKRIAHLELQLGTLLFERTHSRALPTQTSTFISNRATGIMLQSENLMAEIFQIAQGRGGLVRVGFGPAPAYVLLTAIIQSCRKNSPHLVFETTSGSTEQLAELMLGGKIDIAICPYEEDLFTVSFENTLLHEGAIVIAAKPDHPIFASQLLNPSDLFKYQLVLPIFEQRYRQLGKELFGVDIEKLNNLILCSDYSALIKLVLSGEFVTAGPRFAFQEEVEKGSLKVKVFDERVKHQLHLITNRSTLSYPVLDSVIDGIQQAVQSIILPEKNPLFD